MDDPGKIATGSAMAAREALLAVMRNRSKKARFLTEVAAALRPENIGREELELALGELQAEGTVMIRDHFCADPHLAGVDLRIVALVEQVPGTDPLATAIRNIDQAWDKWLGAYLANHRCS